jgi:tRNA(Arg) A34 adenosine deaminase TadA
MIAAAHRSPSALPPAKLEPMTVSDADLVHLRRAVELAREALADGDGPFGSVLVDETGVERFADRNREVTTGDPTRHPEFEIARWAAVNLTAEERAAATVYTSGEHCPMCSAAHAWVGLGRIVYVASAEQIAGWRQELGVPASPVAVLPIRVVAPGLQAEGPVDELVSELSALIVQAVRSQ